MSEKLGLMLRIGFHLNAISYLKINRRYLSELAIVATFGKHYVGYKRIL